MSLTIIEEFKPFFGLRRFNWRRIPSRKQTMRAWQELADKKKIYPVGSLAQAFANGDLTVGTNLIMNWRRLVLEGVYPDIKFPKAMLFWDFFKNCHVQFDGWSQRDDFQIIRR